MNAGFPGHIYKMKKVDIRTVGLINKCHTFVNLLVIIYYCLVLLYFIQLSPDSLYFHTDRECILSKQLNLDMNIWYYSPGHPLEKHSMQASSAKSVLHMTSAIYWKTARIRILWPFSIEGILLDLFLTVFTVN